MEGEPTAAEPFAGLQSGSAAQNLVQSGVPEPSFVCWASAMRWPPRLRSHRVQAHAARRGALKDVSDDDARAGAADPEAR
jgi:hypothetical protein